MDLSEHEKDVVDRNCITKYDNEANVGEQEQGPRTCVINLDRDDKVIAPAEAITNPCVELFVLQTNNNGGQGGKELESSHTDQNVGLPREPESSHGTGGSAVCCVRTISAESQSDCCRENLFDEMLQEREEIALKRKRCKEILRVLQQAAWTLEELPVEYEPVPASLFTGIDATGLPSTANKFVVNGDFISHGTYTSSPGHPHAGASLTTKPKRQVHPEHVQSVNGVSAPVSSGFTGAGYPTIST